MYAGLNAPGVSAPSEPLSDELSEYMERFFVFLHMAPSEFERLSRREQDAMTVLSRTWHISRLYLQRTVTKEK